MSTKVLQRLARLAENELEGIRVGSYAVYVWGRIEYKDAFGMDRFTNYRMKYSGLWPPVGSANLTFCDGGNETDEQSG
jgi:hypothetical protein